MMKRVGFHALAGALLLSCAMPARALDATPAEAERLTHVFETYLGKAAPGESPLFSVIPNGASYRLQFNLQRVFAAFGAAGVKIAMTPTNWTYDLAPQADGKWRVTHGNDLTFDLTLPNMTETIKTEGLRGDGLYDPAIPGFVAYTGDAAKMTADAANSAPDGTRMVMSQSVEGIHQTLTGVMKSDGIESFTHVYTASKATQHIVFTPAVKTPGQTPAAVPIDVSYGALSSNAQIDGMRNRAITALWAWLVAHPSKEAVVAAQRDFKELARAALPVFERATAKADLKPLSVATPVGTFSAGAATVGLTLAGAVAAGEFGESISFRDMVVPTALLPAWAKDMVPRDLDIDFNVGGFDAAAALATILDGMDLAATPPISKDVEASLEGKLLASGGVTVKIAKARVANAAYDISLDGQVRAGPAINPTGAGTVRAKGLDALQKSLTEAAKTDKNAQNALGGLAIARTLAKPGPDGTLVWEIAMGTDGQLTINGNAMGGGKKK